MKDEIDFGHVFYEVFSDQQKKLFIKQENDQILKKNC